MTEKNPTPILKPFRTVLLAAGEGARLGRLPKSLIHLDGQSLLKRQIGALLEAGASHIVVVTGYYFEQIEAELKRIMATCRQSLQIVRHANPERGQQSSVSLGLKALSEVDTGSPILIALADQPLMEATDYQTCVNAFYNRPTNRSIMYPIVNQQRGNPVMLSEAIAHQIIRNGMDCRDFIHAHPEQVYHFSSESDHFVMDIDEQKDLETFKHRTGVTLVLPMIRDSSPS